MNLESMMLNMFIVSFRFSLKIVNKLNEVIRVLIFIHLVIKFDVTSSIPAIFSDLRTQTKTTHHAFFLFKISSILVHSKYITSF